MSTDFPSFDELLARVQQARDIFENVEATKGKQFRNVTEMAFHSIQLMELVVILSVAPKNVPRSMVQLLIDQIGDKAGNMMACACEASAFPPESLKEALEMAETVGKTVSFDLPKKKG
jgi:hypothetical protein